jgi:hypothetical protein
MSRPDAIENLRTALNALADALAAGRPDDVLAAEAPLAVATADFAKTDFRQFAHDPVVRAALMEARLALARCVALGKSAAELAAVMLPFSGYGPAGVRVAARPRAASMASTT